LCLHRLSRPRNVTRSSVEEYDALSVAIQSALTKFAPHHRFYAVRSLAAARRAALEQNPNSSFSTSTPHPGAIAFFGEMRGVLPETRLAHRGRVTPELMAERS
jgi:hypothetical protein